MLRWIKRLFLRSRSAGLEQALAVSPRIDAAWQPPLPAERLKTQADALFDSGDIDRAISAYQVLLEQFPFYGQAWNNLGLCLRLAKRSADAEEAFAQAVKHAPQLAAPWINLATVQETRGLKDAAIVSLDRAIALDPESLEARGNAAELLSSLGRLGAAEEHLRAGLRAHPGDSGLSYRLGLLLTRQGRIPEALEALRQAASSDPTSTVAGSAYLMTLNYADHLSPTFVQAEHRRVAEAFAPARVSGDSRNLHQAEVKRPLRVGYVSADFGYHVVSFFIEPVLASHDQAAVEPFCYYNGLVEDAQCERLRKLGVRWRQIGTMDDDAALSAIRADALDVCVDLSGHTGGHRLSLFAARLAPVQVTWLGYPNTTGMPAMDYRLTDIWADPPGMTERLHSERLERLPSGFLVYGPRPEAPPVGPLPALNQGHVTFGCFNNFAKVSDTALSLWAALLVRIPAARLLLKSRGLDDPVFADRVRARFAAAGGDLQRLTLEGQQAEFSDHLARYGVVDIALDTVPYCGTTTTCEALWMGVPVVSFAGSSHVARVGASLLNQIGRPEWLAQTESEYIAIAAAMAADLDALARTRARLRADVAASMLTDAVGFTRSLEETFCRLAAAAPAEIGGDLS